MGRERIRVADVLGWLPAGMSHEEIFGDYPKVMEEEAEDRIMRKQMI